MYQLRVSSFPGSELHFDLLFTSQEKKNLCEKAELKPAAKAKVAEEALG